MRILRLNLLRFGHFTDRMLDLSAGNCGLHLIYGPNEAGKSTALRALHQLFYGIAARTSDDFVHPYGSMRIGAELTNATGDKLECIRRKGNRNTLRAADDETPIEERDLASWLGGVDEETFRRRYGINYEQLVAGGREIVEGHGDLGQSLFAAGAGVADLRGVQQRLESEAGELFKPSGKNPRINALLAELKSARDRAKQLRLSTSDWKKHDKAFREAQQDYAKLRKREAELQAERDRLERLRDAAALVATLERLEADLAPLGNTPLLPEDFSGRRIEAQSQLANARSDADEARGELQELEKSTASLSVPEPLLRHDATIRQCFEESGAVRKAQRDRPALETQLVDAERELREVLRRLAVDAELVDLESLRLPDAEVVRIQDLGADRKAFEAASEDAKHQVARLEQRLGAVERQLTELGDPVAAAPLHEAVRQADRDVELLPQLRQFEEASVALAAEAEIQLAKLGLWSGELDEARRLAVPDHETCDHGDQQLRTAETSVKDLQDSLTAEQRRLEEVNGHLEELRLAQDVPTEEDLAAARRRREQGWRLVRETWLGAGPEAKEVREYAGDAKQPEKLAETFSRDITAADETADRLRREADRVAQKLRLINEQRGVTQRIESLEVELNTAETLLKSRREEWAGVWSPLCITPRSPREMTAWLRRHAKLVEKIEQLRQTEAEAAALSRRRDACRQALSKTLQAAAESMKLDDLDVLLPLPELLTAGRKLLAELEAAQRRREKLTDERAELEAELTDVRQRGGEAETRLVAWTAQWSPAMQRLGLAPEATPSEANTIIKLRQELFQRESNAASLRQRLAGIASDADEFAARVQTLAREIAPELGEDDDALSIADQLSGMLSDALKNQARREEQEQRKERATRRLREATRAEEKHAAALSALCEEAGCDAADGLPEIERRSRARRQSEQDLRGVRQQLERLAAGTPLDEFLAQVRERDFDDVMLRLGALDDELVEVVREGEQLNQSIGAERTILKGMDGGAQAAEAEEEAQSLLAEIRTAAEQFARLKLAAAVLTGAVERYRERHQGPILQRAGELFTELTLGSFAGLRAEYVEGGKPELVGVRPDGRPVCVSGMSEGTCDQLYLSLRLASLEHELEQREPLPLVVDDIMIMFDDDRSAAALKALARLSEKTQVILFTHHEHLVQLAQQTLDDDILFVQHLGSDEVVRVGE